MKLCRFSLYAQRERDVTTSKNECLVGFLSIINMERNSLVEKRMYHSLENSKVTNSAITVAGEEIITAFKS